MKPLGSRVEAARSFVHDLIFPKRCLGCNKFDNFICSQCSRLLKIKINFYCPVCNKEMIVPSVCSDCSGGSALEKLWIVSDYNNELTKKAIHLIKYNFCEQVSEVWEKLIALYFEKERFWIKEAVLVPVPLHKRRYLERGFNQSMLICEIIKRLNGNIINQDIIERIAYGKHQVELNYNMRKRSVSDCFGLKRDFNYNIDLSREIVLVDDVYTTGATMRECALTLKRAGFQRIYGFAMARG